MYWRCPQKAMERRMIQQKAHLTPEIKVAGAMDLGLELDTSLRLLMALITLAAIRQFPVDQNTMTILVTFVLNEADFVGQLEVDANPCHGSHPCERLERVCTGNPFPMPVREVRMDGKT